MLCAGATNRANAALEAVAEASFGVGLEGGLSAVAAESLAADQRCGMQVGAAGPAVYCSCCCACSCCCCPWSCLCCCLCCYCSCSCCPISHPTSPLHSAAQVFAWMAVHQRPTTPADPSWLVDHRPLQSPWGYAKTASFELPTCVAELVVKEGMELGGTRSTGSKEVMHE